MSGNEEDLRRRLMKVHHDDMMFQALSCNANVSVDTCLGPDAVPFSTIVAAADLTPFDAIVKGVAEATQSSTCWGRPASYAINGDHGNFSHTCENSDSPAWWMVDFGDDNTAVGEVEIVNCQSGRKYRMVGANVEVLDADMSIVASKVVEDEQDIYYFNFDGAIGRHLRIIQHSKFNQAYEPLNIGEVEVYRAPALATGQTPYEHRYIKPGSNLTSEYVTGEAHIPCGVCAIVDYTNGDTVEIPRGINVEGMLYFPPTANVELRTPHLYVQGNLKIDAPNDDDGNKIKVHMIDTGYEQFMIPHVENEDQCSAVGCNFGKKAVGIAGGTLDIQALPDPSCPTWTFLKAVLDEEEGTNQVLEVGSKAAECWGRRLGNEILITDTIGWKSYASLIGTIASVNIDAGTVTLSSPPTTHTESNEKDFSDFNGQAPAGWISTLANDPDYPAEVAILSSSVTFDADTTQGNAGGRSWHCNVEQRRIGGHMMISHTSAVQRIEGVEFKNFGQSGKLGRYPIHFHICGDVSGSIVRKNIVRSSHQRCVVVHRSNNVIVEENVAFGHKGHCFMTEDRVETGNVFRKNLGADGQSLTCVENILGDKGDNQASTYWISNPKNQFIDNVAAGSINGFWISGGNDPIGMFSGNIAHSNLNEGIKLYEGNYRPNAPSLFVNSKSFRNYRQGVRLHLNKNIVFKGLLLADNGIAVSSFDNNNEIVFEDMTVIGLTAKAREFSVSLNPPISSGLHKETGICRFCQHTISGVKFASDPGHTQLSLQSVSFHGFEPHFDGTSEYDILALRLWGAFPGMHGAGGTILHGGDKRFWNMPFLEGVTIDSTDNGFDFERQLLTDQPQKMHGYFQDVNGTFHVDGPGVFIPQDSSGVVPDAPEFSFLADHRCNKANSRPDSLALFCAGSCIRKVFVHSNCPGDLLVTSTSTNEQSTFPPTRFRTLSAGWGKGYATDVWSTNLHVAFLPNDHYQLGCKNESGEIVNPKYMKVTFDGKTYQIRNNNNCCEHGWYDMNFARPPPLCSPYVDQGSFQLPEVPLYQHYEANEFLHPSNVAAEADGIKLWGVQFGGAHFGPVNFGTPGESRAVLLNWKKLSSHVRVHMRLDDGTLIGSVGNNDVEIDIPPEVSGIHEVIFTAHRFAGTHHFAKIISFDILPPFPTTSPTMSPAPTSSLVPTGIPPSMYELACGSSGSACAGRRQSAEINELHPLRCCADFDLGKAWERKYPNSCPAGVFGASKLGDTCHKAVTFSEGKSICESKGGRLCTIREVLSNCVRWTGCQLDKEMIWTATDTKSVMGIVFTPNDNSKWFPFGSTLEDTGELAFSVKATNDAHVALGSAEVHPTSRYVPNHVEIFIGGWGNKRSGIRPATGDVKNQIETSGAYLSGSDYDTFRISWTPTDIKLEHLAVCDWVPMVTMDRSSLGIIIDRAIVMTGWGSSGEFKHFQGLPSSCEASPSGYGKTFPPSDVVFR
eukprot:CAMPEP_0184861662 /NCGR_PEP_ID=MMETSP0580-20130426/6290_1 /TAXON_ID=1118495 /ORGANISM="Dactyliosolen fragilissimus" /LENGTH=1463 /DNA_ID=CAMNT_0027359231 /DNA_START=285 /DNA_END=4674 /DNA_ORIENTATION=-